VSVQQDPAATSHSYSFFHRFGLYNLIGTGFVSDDEASDSDSDSSDSACERALKRRRIMSSPTNYKIKEDSAEDYFDITELADEPPAGSYDSKDDYDIEDAIPAAKVGADGSYESKNPSDDKDLMPPPPLDAAPSVKQDDGASTSTETTPAAVNGTCDKKSSADKKLTPLGAMLPSKYANVDVTDLFPDFRQDKVLRFSRLFGPGKFSSLPQIWRSVRRKAKKRRKEREKQGTSESNTSDSDVESKRSNGFNLKFAATPPRDMVLSDDEDKLLSEKTNDEKEEKLDDSQSSDQKAKAAADWRFGPAQIWYDMLDVPETGEGFNYGFKVREKVKTEEVSEAPRNEEEDDQIPDDAYLMVSQLHWEEDVVWDGSLIKDKVEQKLNSKFNAAGWLPSSGSRTAAFSQPGKSNLPGSLSDKKSNVSNIIGKYGKAQQQKPQEDPDETWYSIFPVENEELVYSKWEEEVIWDCDGKLIFFLN
jgi:transcription initiation factor TFIID subunit 1